jgi:hypothetical protein
MTGRLDFFNLPLLLESTDRGPDSSDRLRTLFVKKHSHYRMTAYQIPDSAYVLGLARERLAGAHLVFRAYEKAKRVFSGNPALEGWYFELVFHAVVRSDYGRPRTERQIKIIHRLVAGTGSNWQDDLAALAAPNVYWTPRMYNFPVIDSALVYEGTLYAFQCTIRPDHSFDARRFREMFEQVQSAISEPLSTTAVVYAVHPRSVAFEWGAAEVSVPPRMATRSASGPGGKPSEGFTLTIQRRQHPVNVVAEGTFIDSVIDLFRTLSGPSGSSAGREA